MNLGTGLDARFLKIFISEVASRSVSGSGWYAVVGITPEWKYAEVLGGKTRSFDFVRFNKRI